MMQIDYKTVFDAAVVRTTEEKAKAKELRDATAANFTKPARRNHERNLWKN